MSNLIICLILGSIALVQGQPSIQLQFLGTEIPEAEQSNFNFCESGYCLLDADYLFAATTQNESIKPCEDFEEFALGNLIKYRAISDRVSSIGFEEEQNIAFALRLKRVLSEKINDKDIAVTKSIKQFYSKCVNSDYVRRNGVKEMREYLATLGLKYYPDTDQNDFKISNYFEKNFDHAIRNLLGQFLIRNKDGQLLLGFRGFYDLDQYLKLSDIEELFYEMFQVYLNNSNNVQIFKQEFHEIATNIMTFHKIREKSYTDYLPTKYVAMSFEELNDLTSKLDLDWFKLINNQLLTKITADEKILVETPSTIKIIIDFLISSDKKLLADYLAYDFILRNSKVVEVYQSLDRKRRIQDAKRSAERWDQCLGILTDTVGPALTFLYHSKYRDEKQEEAAQDFINEAKEFVARKLKKDSKWNETFTESLINRINSLNVIVGYSEMILDPHKIQEIYADLRLSGDQSLVEMNSVIQHFFKKLEREPMGSRFRELYAIPHYVHLSYQSSFFHDREENKLLVHPSYLHYPFYHNKRPRFFNSATLAQRFFSQIKHDYKDSDYNIFELLIDSYQAAYEFYDEWLKSGGKDLQLGAHRLSDQQLYWIAAARVFYSKLRADVAPQRFASLHERYLLKPGFREAFRCLNTSKFSR